VGAIGVNWIQSWLTTSYPDLWLLFLGALFMSVVLFIPEGVVGALARLAQALRRRPVRTLDAPHLGQATLGSSGASGSDTR
jgi:urea transport system permease protein